MVAIRLSRTGAKKKPSYRVVVIDKRRARDSRSIEIVGHYNARRDPIEVVLKRDRISYWIGVGAQPSDRVKRLMKVFDEREAKRLAELAEREAEEAKVKAAAAQAQPEPEVAATQAAPSAPGAPLQEGTPGDQPGFDPGDDEVDRQLEEALAAEAGSGRGAESSAG